MSLAFRFSGDYGLCANGSVGIEDGLGANREQPRSVEQRLELLLESIALVQNTGIALAVFSMDRGGSLFLCRRFLLGAHASVAPS